MRLLFLFSSTPLAGMVFVAGLDFVEGLDFATRRAHEGNSHGPRVPTRQPASRQAVG
jgi:hypothetical protein